MPNGELDKPVVVESPKSHSALIATVSAGLVLALAGDGYLMVRSNRLSEELARTQEDTQTQMAKVSAATTALLNQRLDTINADLKTAQDSADTAVKRTRMEALRQAKDLNHACRRNSRRCPVSLPS